MVYRSLVSAGGASRMNALALGIPKVVTFCQLKNAPSLAVAAQLSVVCQTPGPAVAAACVVSGNDPSCARRSIIFEAASSPILMPSILGWPSAIAASDAVRRASRFDALPGKYADS